MFQSSLSSVSFTDKARPEGTVAVPASNFQVSLAMAIALSTADCVMPTLVRLLPRGPKSGLVRELLSSS